MIADAVKVVLALSFVQTAFALYFILTKSALDSGMSPGVFVLLRDLNTSILI